MVTTSHATGLEKTLLSIGVRHFILCVCVWGGGGGGATKQDLGASQVYPYKDGGRKEKNF